MTENDAEKDPAFWDEQKAKYRDMLRWVAIQEQATELQLKHPDWRRGQALFNALHGVHPELANAVRGTPADPFHHDDHDFVQRFAAVVMAGHIHVPNGFGCACGWKPTPPDSATYSTQHEAHVTSVLPPAETTRGER